MGLLLLPRCLRWKNGNCRTSLNYGLRKECILSRHIGPNGQNGNLQSYPKRDETKTRSFLLLPPYYGFSCEGDGLGSWCGYINDRHFRRWKWGLESLSISL